MQFKCNTTDFNEPLSLCSGGTLPASWYLAYETYGELNAQKDNAILICHALTTGAHAAGKHHASDPKAGWWDAVIGPGKPFDTNRFFVICSNVIGGCHGSTGPGSPSPTDGKPYALRFPVVTIADMVQAQALLADRLCIDQFYAIAGGCMGGFQVLEWMAHFPSRLRKAIIIGATARTSPYTLALWHVMRSAIRLDPAFQQGNYYEKGHVPRAGMNLATAIGMLIRMNPLLMEEKFGRRLTHEGTALLSLEPEFEIEAFFERIGKSGAERFDPNSLIYLTRAMDYFDLTANGRLLDAVLGGYGGDTLLISYESDWRYPPAQVDEIRLALESHGATCSHRTLQSRFGHGAFIYDHEHTGKAIADFLDA